MKVQSWQHYKGEATSYSIDWSVKAGKLGTTVSSATWTVESGSATITSEALASDVTSALVTTASEGNSLIKITAVLADGQTDIFFFKVKALDPVNPQATLNKY